MKKFPKTLFVKRERDSAADYFVPHESVLTAAELGEKTKVGVYKLVGTQEIEGVVVSTRHMQKA
jgi:hypothetical protein